MSDEQKEYPMIRCGKEFVELLEVFKKEWLVKNSFSISNSDATNLIAKKIELKGGLRV